MSTLYELPFGRGKKFGTDSDLLDEVIGGWTIGTIAELHTGTPLTVIDAVNNTNSFSDGVRPDLVGDFVNKDADYINEPITIGAMAAAGISSATLRGRLAPVRAQCRSMLLC